MKKLIGFRKLKTAVFISGNGSNLKNLVKFSNLKNSPIKIELVISSNAKAKGLSFAKNLKLKSKVFSFKNRKDDIKIVRFLKKNNINFICLAGFMKILSNNFITNFNGRILNIHPSLLPKYKGLNTHQRVLDNKEKFSGCTVHLVNAKLDSGKIILQKRVKISKNDNAISLSKKILKHEHSLYPKAIKKFIFNS